MALGVEVLGALGVAVLGALGVEVLGEYVGIAFKAGEEGDFFRAK